MKYIFCDKFLNKEVKAWHSNMQIGSSPFVSTIFEEKKITTATQLIFKDQMSPRNHLWYLNNEYVAFAFLIVTHLKILTALYEDNNKWQIELNSNGSIDSFV